MRHSPVPEGTIPFDLHVLSLPPAFVLSQDQTLKLIRNSEPSTSKTSQQPKSQKEPLSKHINTQRSYQTKAERPRPIQSYLMRENNSSAKQPAKPPPAHPFHNLHIHNNVEPAPFGTNDAGLDPRRGGGLYDHSLSHVKRFVGANRNYFIAPLSPLLAWPRKA